MGEPAQHQDPLGQSEVNNGNEYYWHRTDSEGVIAGDRTARRAHVKAVRFDLDAEPQLVDEVKPGPAPVVYGPSMWRLWAVSVCPRSAPRRGSIAMAVGRRDGVWNPPLIRCSTVVVRPAARSSR